MTDNELNSIKNKLSEAYFLALAAKLNYAANPTNRDFDGCGIDYSVINHNIGVKRTVTTESSMVMFQLKCTSIGSQSMVADDGDVIKYRLDTPLNNFKVNAYLVVVIVPKNEEVDNWITLSQDELILKKCAYYIRIPDDGLSAGIVKIPKNNVFTFDSLRNIFETISKEDF